MYDYFPDSPEAVALALMREILEREEAESGESHERRNRRNRPTRDAMLDLFGECLKAARGDRVDPATRGLLQ